MIRKRSKKNEVIVIDAIQKLPALLDEIHNLIETTNIHFILTGSSARKLKRSGVNLLAGRAWQANLFPLVSPEITDFNLDRYLLYGGFPQVYASDYPDEELDLMCAHTSRKKYRQKRWFKIFRSFPDSLKQPLSATPSKSTSRISQAIQEFRQAPYDRISTYCRTPSPGSFSKAGRLQKNERLWLRQNFTFSIPESRTFCAVVHRWNLRQPNTEKHSNTSSPLNCAHGYHTGETAWNCATDGQNRVQRSISWSVRNSPLKSKRRTPYPTST